MPHPYATANYRARAAGLSKLMAIDEAKRRCPEVALISGEDLTPYRLGDGPLWFVN